jgi:preprotein translocase subunit SecB
MESNIAPPYEIEVEAVGYFRYVGGDEFKGVDRFRAVRFSGYQILHGAIREMVSNLTARARHGLWHLPARNFGDIAKTQAEEDEERRQKLHSAMQTTSAIENPKPPRKKLVRKSAKSSAA